MKARTKTQTKKTIPVAKSLTVDAYVFTSRIEAKLRRTIHNFKDLDEARTFAEQKGFSGIQVQFR